MKYVVIGWGFKRDTKNKIFFAYTRTDFIEQRVRPESTIASTRQQHF